MIALNFTRVPTLSPIVGHVREQIGRSALEQCFLAQGVPVDVIERPGAVLPMRDLFGLFEHFARASGDQAFGLAAGQVIDPARFGVLVEYAMQGPSLAEAIIRLDRSLPLHQGGTTMALTTMRDRAVWSYKVDQPYSTGRHHHAVQSLVQMQKFVSDYLGHEPVLQEIGIEAGEYGFSDTLDDVFRAPVLRSSRANYIAFRSTLLARGRPADVTQAPAVTFGDLIRYARSTPPIKTSEKVAATLRLFLESGQASIDQVSAHLGIGMRTLQRRLSAEGSTFHDILEQVRRGRAEELVLDTNLPMIKIADLLGYSDPAHFSRAYKRWHGQAPIQLRSKGRNENDPGFIEDIGQGEKNAA